MRKTSFSTWLSRDREARKRLEALVAGLPRPYRRRRPRRPDEARLLRERGAPERLIGPDGPESDLPPLEENPLWELVGMSDAEPVDDMDEFLYGPEAKT